MMTYTDGTTVAYGVFQGRMKSRKCFDVHSATLVASYQCTEKPSDKLYRFFTAKHATKEAPAVSWQA